jgi:hypothetical protein
MPAQNFIFPFLVLKLMLPVLFLLTVNVFPTFVVVLLFLLFRRQKDEPYLVVKLLG